MYLFIFPYLTTKNLTATFFYPIVVYIKKIFFIGAQMDYQLIMQPSIKTRNAFIDLFRIVCAVMVVIIHAKPFKDVNPYFESFFVNYFPRIAVPFFLCTISFYYVQKLNSGISVKSTWIRLFRVYVFWSAVYFVYSLVYSLATNRFSILSFLENTVYGFFVNGIGYQLWFFPAVFLGLFILTICHKLKILKFASIFSLVFYIIGLLGSIYYEVGMKIPLISSLISKPFFYAYVQRPLSLGLNFIFMGYFLCEFLKSYKKNNKIIFVLFAITVLLFFLEIFLARYFNLYSNVKLSVFLYPLTFLVMTLLLSNSTQNKKIIKFSKATRDISNFMYYSHVLVLALFRIFDNFVIKIPYFYTISCFGTIVITFLVGLLIHKSKNQKIKDFIL